MKSPATKNRGSKKKNNFKSSISSILSRTRNSFPRSVASRTNRNGPKYPLSSTPKHNWSNLVTTWRTIRTSMRSTNSTPSKKITRISLRSSPSHSMNSSIFTSRSGRKMMNCSKKGPIMRGFTRGRYKDWRVSILRRWTRSPKSSMIPLDCCARGADCITSSKKPQKRL